MKSVETARAMFSRRDVGVLSVLAMAVVLLGAVRLVVGTPMGWAEPTVTMLRAHRLVTGLACGAGLAVAGGLLQALLRNPLASPYIVGVSSGAALGVVAAVAMGGAAGQWGGRGGMAFAAALMTLVVLYLLSQRRGWVDPLGLLLVGVILNAMNGAVIMLVQALWPRQLGVPLMQWMFGRLNENVTWPWLWGMTAVVGLGLGVSVALGRSIDVATLPAGEAQSVGLHVGRLRLVMFGLAGLLTAVAVQLAGPVGFVGLIGPHGVRLLLGPRHGPMLLGSALAGGGLVVGADVAVKLVQVWGPGQGQLPIGVLLALVGGPVFLVMLRRQLGRGALG